MAKGKFITFEGGEGSGKSTQVHLLAERLRAQGIDVIETREPGGSPFAERLRGVILDPATEPHGALSEALLFYAARADHLEKTVRPALASGAWVLCDRFSDSTRVYQVMAGELPPTVFDVLEHFVVGTTKPDLTFVIDVPVETGLARAALRLSQQPPSGKKSAEEKARRGQGAKPLLADRFESRDWEFHKRLREGFLAIAAANPERCAVIDGQKSADETAAAVWTAAERRLLAGAR